jgi:thiamine-monophosphate kinase
VSPEFSLIFKQIAPVVGSDPELVLGIGDDAALVSLPEAGEQVLAMDTLVAGRHFFPEQSAYDVGWKALAVNLSDLASMGAVPRFALLSLSLPQHLVMDQQAMWVSEFMRGWQAVAQPFGVVLIGGDTTVSPTLSISVTVIGYRPASSRAMLRQSAQVDDDLWVSGSIGSAGLALALLLSGEMPTELLAQALHRPLPRIALGQALLPLVNAAMDVSDGLLADLSHILHASGGIGAELYWEEIPMRVEVKAWADADAFLPLIAGDDYELLFSASARQRDAIMQTAQACQTPVTRIGRLTAQSGMKVIKNGQVLSLPSRLGFDHFQS